VSELEAKWLKAVDPSLGAACAQLAQLKLTFAATFR